MLLMVNSLCMSGQVTTKGRSLQTFSRFLSAPAEHFVSLGLAILPVVSYSSQTFRIFKPGLLFSNDRFIVPVVLFMLYLLSDHHLPFLHLLLFNNSPFDSHYLFTARRHHRDVVFHLHLSPEQQTKRY